MDRLILLAHLAGQRIQIRLAGRRLLKCQLTTADVACIKEPQCQVGRCLRRTRDGLAHLQGALEALVLDLDAFERNLDRAVREAMTAGAGLAFLHSHPFPGWQGMSPDDVRAEEKLAAATSALPFGGCRCSAVRRRS